MRHAAILGHRLNDFGRSEMWLCIINKRHGREKGPLFHDSHPRQKILATGLDIAVYSISYFFKKANTLKGEHFKDIMWRGHVLYQIGIRGPIYGKFRDGVRHRYQVTGQNFVKVIK